MMGYILISYPVIGLATAGVVRYNQCSRANEWVGTTDAERLTVVVFAAVLWPVMWLVFMPFMCVVNVAERLGDASRKRRESRELK